MNSISENMFLKAPIVLQNIALTIYGFKANRIRHGGSYNRFFKQIKEQRQLNVKDLNNHINFSLRETIKNAVQSVPYYRSIFNKVGLDYKDIREVKDLKKMPFLRKSLIRNDPLIFLNEKYKKRELLCIHTTGTTGTPLRIFCNNRTRQWNYAFYEHFLSESRINFAGKRATLGGRIIMSSRQKKPPFWRYSYLQKNLLFSSYHLTEENIPHYITKLSRFKPAFIDAYPSSIYTIARYALKYNINMKNITNGITTSAETLLADQREVIETVFGVPIIDQYGAAEMCVFVGQCKEGSYHIHSNYSIVEFIREDGTQAQPGEEAELACTSLINPVMPLLRYRIGDRGVLSEKKCECGSPFPVMETIIGRIDDIIITPDGRRVGRLSPVLKGFPVKEVQYIQDSKKSVEVFIVKDNGYTKKTDKKIINELTKRLGHEIMINIKYTQTLTRGPGGKLKTIISSIS